MGDLFENTHEWGCPREKWAVASVNAD